MAGRGGPAADAERLLQKSLRLGTATLGSLAYAAVRRLLGDPARALHADRLFTDAERGELAEALASVLAPADLLGRTAVRERLEKFDEGPPLKPMAPLQALEWFRRLVPVLGVSDPRAWEEANHQAAFTAAAATDATLLGKIKDLILHALETGERVRSTPQAVEDLLTAAGASPRSPAYVEMLVRTNLMRAYTEGAWQEMQHPEVREKFPAWQYLAVDDGRARPTHAARNGKYYPAHVRFDEVRGTGIKDVANCRCNFRPVGAREWRRLREAGHDFASFAERDVSDEPRDGRGRWTKGGAGKKDGAKANARKGAKAAREYPHLASEKIPGPELLPGAEARAVGRIPPPRLDNYVRTVDGLIRTRMPPAAGDRLARHVKAVKFHNSVEDVNASLVQDAPGLKPVLDEHDGYYALAAYSPKDGTLYLDGNFGGAVDGVYAHELGHAIDGPDFELSGSRQWQAIWSEEIYREKNPPLSHYANTSRVEAFAEFCQAIYGETDLGEVEKRLPRAAAFFKERGLWPTK